MNTNKTNDNTQKSLSPKKLTIIALFLVLTGTLFLTGCETTSGGTPNSSNTSGHSHH
jgi:hypothetical protein